MRRKDKEITGNAEIESIIAKADVCRIAMAENDIPYIVTMNFGYERGTHKKLFFHCASEGKKLEILRKNNYVCFEMDTDHRLNEGDNACDFGMGYRSVVGWGRITFVLQEDEKKAGLNHIMSHYTGRSNFSYDQKSLGKIILLRLDITEMTAKRS